MERGNGPGHAERLDADPIPPMSAGRGGRLHLDLARGYAQNDPIARDLVLTVNRRAPRRVWELNSLSNRFGMSQTV